ncbi:polycystin-1-like protein 1 [Spinachia spinachia]
MFAVSFCALISLHPMFCSRWSAAALPRGGGGAPWFVGCVAAGGSLHGAGGARDLDPAVCCVRCREKGYQVAALTSEACYCGNQQRGFLASECFNTSSSGGTKDERGERQSVLYLPVGGDQGNVALYRTEGPFLHSVRLSTSPDKVQAGKTFVMEVSGNLAGRPNQPTGILGLGERDLSYVTVEFGNTTPSGQSSHRVNVLDDGSFVGSSVWIFATPGKYQLNVSVSNPLSKASSSLHLSVLQSSADGMVVSVPHGPLGVPSSSFPQRGSNRETVEEAYLGDPVAPQAHVTDSLAGEVFRWTVGNKKEEKKKVVKTACPPTSDCSISAVDNESCLRASLLFTSDPTSVPLSDLLPGAFAVDEITRARISPRTWRSAVPTRTEVHLRVVGPVSRMGSRVVWTFGVDNNTGISRSTEGWSVNVSLTAAGRYNVTAEALNPISRAWLCTRILAQDPVGELLLNVPGPVTAHRRHPVSFTVTAGSNVTVSLLVNATLMHRNGSYAAGEETTVVLLFDQTGTVVVELRAENRVSSQNKSVKVHVEVDRKLSPKVRVNPTWRPPSSQSLVHNRDDNVWIYAEKRAYPTNTDITFVAMPAVPDPVEFLWHFGNLKSKRTSSRTVTERYNKPGRYAVVVVMSRGRTSITSDVFPLVVQRAVRLNRLVHRASVLQNQTVTVSCRLSVGTDVTFLWSFGDGKSRLGQSTEQHVFHRTGEFRVEVTVSNLVSSASLSGPLFVVDRHCQPPPLKNMGPLKLQVRRHEVVYLGVTFEAELDCDLSGGLNYTWTLFDSAGRLFPLPLVDTHRNTLILPSLLLHYDTYTALATVRVGGSVVYSNYSVRVQVIPSPPVTFVRGGTNIFINNRNDTVVTLDGQRSYDPDFPTHPVSFSWTCKPVRSITSSCFHHDLPTLSPVLAFPASSLKHTFDQFQFSLTIHSGERSASSETFLTVTPNVIGKVSVSCPQCQGDQVNWHKSFSVGASCEGCNVSPQYMQYTWSLYLVNVSSKPVMQVPFCYTVDLSAPSGIVEGSAISPLTPGTSTHYPPAPDLMEAELSPGSSLVDIKTEGSGEGPSYHFFGEYDPPKPSYSSTEHPQLTFDNSGAQYADRFRLADVISEFPIESESSADWDFSFPVLENGDTGVQQVCADVRRLNCMVHHDDCVPDSDYDVPLMSAEEGNPGASAGRPTGMDVESFSPGDESFQDPALHEDGGNNLIHSRPSVVMRESVLLDLPRDRVDTGLFESYTYTGISSPWLSFRPYSLIPGSRYMLAITAKSHDGFLGRTQLFLKTNPAPKGVTCQVQPVRGRELYTHFSIFCASGKGDLVYEYSVRVGDGPPRILYEGRDFQYYFSLPSGDPNDDHKVTISTEIKSSMDGTASEPCPVTVRVQPSFFRDAPTSSHGDPDLELSESGLRNLSALVRLGNGVEIRNYVSLLSGILNRLSLGAEANARAQRRTRNVLIGTMCELQSSAQASLEDNICILKNLLGVTSQVTLASARRVTVHTRVISEQFSRTPAWYSQKTLNTLVALLSHCLQAALTTNDLGPEMSAGADITQALASDQHEEMQDSPISTKQALQLVADILQTAVDLMLKYILSHEGHEHRVSTGLIALYAASLNQTPAVLSSGSAAFHLPDSLVQRVFVHGSRAHRPCVLSVLTELSYSPYTQTALQPSGPVIDLSFYKCSTKRKIPVRPLVQPMNITLQQPPRTNAAPEYVLLRSRVNYHSFNITQEHLHQAIQLSVVFTPPLNKVFPIMLLFRMLERPTPSVHHLHRIHQWEKNTTRFTLPPSYLSTAGIGHLALLNANLGKTSRHKHLSEQVSYSVTVDSSLCLSWDGHQGAWTPDGCRTRQADMAAAVNCSCHQLRPLTVVRQPIVTSHDTTDLDPLLSVSRDLTVLAVLVLCLCLYVPGLVACQRADVGSEANRRAHFLSDNSPCDPYLYSVTIHTGPRSAARMSAKVYIVLRGKFGFSQTRELQVPGCNLFRRNSQDTFILSTAESLGPVWGVHIWHDNCGPSPNWYLKQVEVSEVRSGHVKGQAWLFLGQCWLAVNKDDGRVDKMLRVCTHGISFSKMLYLKLSDYLADYHIWVSLYSCPWPSSFTHTQRLGASLLLLSGYACVNAVIVSKMNDRLPFELGLVDLSAVSLTTGVLSVVAALPASALTSFLFRLRELKPMGSVVQHATGRPREKDPSGDALLFHDSVFEPQLYWNSLQQWAQETWMNKYQGTETLSVSTTILENKSTGNKPVIPSDVVTRKEDSLEVKSYTGPTLQNVDGAPWEKEVDILSKNSRFPGPQRALLSGTRDGSPAIQKDEDHRGELSSDCSYEEDFHQLAEWPAEHIDGLKGGALRPLAQWSHYLAWSLCLLLSLFGLVFSAVLGLRFNSSKVLLWIHSLFFSLMFCIFLIQPALIMAAAVCVSFWHRKRSDFHSFSSVREIEKDTANLWSHNDAKRPAEPVGASAFPPERCSYLEKLLGDRRRARYLRLVRPPTAAELRKTGAKKRRETLLHITLREVSLCGCMLLLMLCISYGTSVTDHCRLNKAVRKWFMSGDEAFMSIQKHEHWWKWTHGRLLGLLYKNASTMTESHILIGEPILWKTEMSNSLYGQGLVPTATPPKTRDHLDCHLGPSAIVGLGHRKSDAASKLRLLHSEGWLCRQTVSVQFTLFSPAPNLFTSVTVLSEQSPTGALLPSVQIRSVRVYHTPAAWDYVVMVCQLLFLVFSLLQFWDHVYAIGQQGLMGYWRTPYNCLDVSLLTVSLLHYVHCIYHSSLILEVVELLQRHNYRGHVDVSLPATVEQHIRTLRGITLLLLTTKAVTGLRLNGSPTSSATLLPWSLSSLLWPTVPGLILMAALSGVGSLLLEHRSWAPRGLRLSGCHVLYRGVWTAVVTALVSSLARRVKRSKKWGNVFTVTELAAYIRHSFCELIGKRRQAWHENPEEGKTYYFEEFESLVDELLFRLDVFSDSLHCTLPPKAPHHREGDRPVIPREPFNMDAQGYPSGNRAVSGNGETLAAPRLLRSKHELQILQRGQRGDHSSSDDVVERQASPPPETMAKENARGRRLHTHLEPQNYHFTPESTSRISVWTKDVPEKQVIEGSKTNERRCLIKTQATCSEMTVQVLVHQEPGSVEPGK